ncbi:hypothetical protein ACRAWD_29795 [Caulobacter segnis]
MRAILVAAAARAIHDPFDAAADDLIALLDALRQPAIDIVARGGAQAVLALARRRRPRGSARSCWSIRIRRWAQTATGMGRSACSRRPICAAPN